MSACICDMCNSFLIKFGGRINAETLAIFDLLKKPSLNKKEEKEVKEVAIKTLQALKQKKLKISGWRESKQVTAQIKMIIYDHLQWLPQEAYADDEVNEKTDLVYQHIYSTYCGENRSSKEGVG